MSASTLLSCPSETKSHVKADPPVPSSGRCACGCDQLRHPERSRKYGQAAAERERVAVVTEAEGAKQSLILNAEARLEAARKDAEAQMVAAKDSAESIKFITEEVKENNASDMFLLGDRYITALQKMSSSENSKIIVMPGDLVGAVKSLIGGK